MQLLDIIGILGGITTTISYVPQIIKIYKTKSADDVSYGMYFLLYVGLGFWFTYGLMINATHMVIANLITVGFMTIIMYMKYKYKDHRLNDSQHKTNTLLCNECKHKL